MFFCDATAIKYSAIADGIIILLKPFGGVGVEELGGYDLEAFGEVVYFLLFRDCELLLPRPIIKQYTCTIY